MQAVSWDESETGSIYRKFHRKLKHRGERAVEAGRLCDYYDAGT